MSLYPFDHLSYKGEYRISIPQRVPAFSKKIEVFNFHLCFFIAELWDFQLKSKLSFFGLIWGRTDLNNFLIFLVKFGGDAIWNLWQTMGSNTEKYLFLIQLTISSYVCLRAKIKTLLENNKFPVLNNKIKTNKLLWIKRCLKNTKLLMAKTISKCMYKDVSELPQHVTQSSLWHLLSAFSIFGAAGPFDLPLMQKFNEDYNFITMVHNWRYGSDHKKLRTFKT